MTIRPGQTTPNELETAILEWIAVERKSLRTSIPTLHVLSREYTGVGAFTNFVCDASADSTLEESVELDGFISIPSLEHGMGATLFLKGDRPDALEVFVYADATWDGVHDGFVIKSR